MTNGHKVAQAFWHEKSPGVNHFVFYAPVDSGRYAPDLEKCSAARRDLGYLHDEIVIGTIGNHVWQKNHRLLIEAARDLSPLYPKIRFVVFGATHGAYRKKYEKTVQRPAELLNHQFPNYIRFVDPGQHVDYWIQALDIFVLTSHAEGVPIALFEAMSAAKPVVSTEVGSICEIVDEGHTGFLVVPGAARPLVDRLRQLVENSPLRCSMGRAGRQRILEQFSIARVIEAHVSAYEAALEAHAHRTVC